MPFKSEAQRKYLYSKHPRLAKRWAKQYGNPKNLPKKLSKGKTKQRVEKSK